MSRRNVIRVLRRMMMTRRRALRVSDKSGRKVLIRSREVVAPEQTVGMIWMLT